jgi:hypothetical protein
LQSARIIAKRIAERPESGTYNTGKTLKHMKLYVSLQGGPAIANTVDAVAGISDWMQTSVRIRNCQPAGDTEAQD